MKKAIVLLLALGMIATFAVAQDAPAPVFTVGMYGDATVTLLDTAGNTGYGLYTETYLSYKASNWGVAATVVGGTDFFATPRNYSFWYTFLDGMVKVYAGKLRETGGVRFATYIEGNGLSTRLGNAANGVMLTAKPVDGLVISAFAPFTGAAIATDLANSGFGASYTITDIAQIVAGYNMGTTTDEIWASVSVKAVKDITLILGFKNVGATSYVYVTGGTSALVPGLNLGLDADIVLATVLGYGAEVLVDYTVVENIVVGTKLSYDNGDAWFANNGVAIKPFVKFVFGDADIKIGFNYSTGNSSYSIPIDFEISF